MAKQQKSVDGLTLRRAKTANGLTVGPTNRSKSASSARKKNSMGLEQPVRRVTKSTNTKKAAQAPAPKKQGSRDDFLKPVGTLGFDLTSEDLERERKKKLRKNGKPKWSKKRKIGVGIGAFILIALIAGLAWIWILLSKMTNGNENLFSAIGALVSDYVDLKEDENGRTNVLVFGTSGYNMEGDEGNGTHDGAQLTDSIMVISLDQDTKDVAMISIPRDLKVKMGCSAGKINEVYWCNNKSGNDDKAGAAALETQLKEVLGLDIQYYAHINWESLVQIVDTVGGITVTLDEDINDSWTKTYIKAGEATTLNGEQALGLARARHGTTGGDFTRGNSQQKILIALEQKVLEKGLGVTDAVSLMNVLGDNLRMDFSLEEVKSVAHMATEFDLKNMRQISLTSPTNGDSPYLTTGTISGVSYVLPVAGYGKYTDIQAYIKKMTSSDAVVREGAKVLVLNGSSTSGVAATEKTKLEEKGITVSKIGDAPSKTYSGYSIYMLNSDMTGTKERLESIYSGVTVQSSDALPQGIKSTGYDFVVIVGNTETSEEG